MTTDEHSDRARAILTEAKRAAELGLDRMVLKLTRKRKPRNWDRVRVLPGVWGRIIGSDSGGVYYVVVAIVDVVAALERVMLPAAEAAK